MKRLFDRLAIMTADGRKAWAFFSILVFCGIMTAFAAVALYLVRGDLFYVFWLGLAAHAQLAVAITGLLAFFVRRDVVISKDSVRIKDMPVHSQEDINAVFASHQQDLRGLDVGAGSVSSGGRVTGQPSDERGGEEAER